MFDRFFLSQTNPTLADIHLCPDNAPDGHPGEAKRPAVAAILSQAETWLL